MAGEAVAWKHLFRLSPFLMSEPALVIIRIRAVSLYSQHVNILLISYHLQFLVCMLDKFEC